MKNKDKNYKDELPKLMHKIHQLEKRVKRNKKNGDKDKAQFKEMRIQKLHNKAMEIIGKLKKKK